MPKPVPAFRESICRALDAARFCSTSRWWKQAAWDRFYRDFGTELTRKEADEAFEKHARDFSKEVRKEKGHHEDDFIYRLIAESEAGEVYFHFTLDEDPDDPQIVIESAHKPQQ